MHIKNYILRDISFLNKSKYIKRLVFNRDPMLFFLRFNASYKKMTFTLVITFNTLDFGFPWLSPKVKSTLPWLPSVFC